MSYYDVKNPKNNQIKAADVAAMAGAAVEQEEESNLKSMKSNLGQYTGATLEGGTARLDKFARYDFLKKILGHSWSGPWPWKFYNYLIVLYLKNTVVSR